jgi:protein-tyrosine phosphatase
MLQLPDINRRGLRNMIKKPIEHCYWVLPGKLLAGEYPITKENDSSLTKINALLRCGITAFINLTQVNEGLRPYDELLAEASHKRFGILDVSIPDSDELTVAILDTIDTHIKKGEMVYLHCWGGIGRTGLIVGCWLARHGAGGETALARLHELWQQCPKSAYRRSPETREQEHYILNWKPGR